MGGSSGPLLGTFFLRAGATCGDKSELAPADVGHVNAHGLSTVPHDRAEALAIRHTLGDVPVTAPKSFFGNLGGGTGAVELAATLLAFESGKVPFTLNFAQADPLCPINVVQQVPAAVARRTAIALNHNLMGQSVAMVVTAES